jgi:hypothetical protein
VKLAWPVEVEPVARGRGSRVRATTRGISIGGAFIVTDLALEPGTPIYVWLYPPLPGGRPSDAGATVGATVATAGATAVLRFRAEVRWVSEVARRDMPCGFGVAFRALTAADEVALHGYFSRAHKVL